MKRMIVLIGVVGSLLIAPIQNFAEVHTDRNQKNVVNNNVISEYNEKYYSDYKKETGWKSHNGKWYYTHTNGTVATGWTKVNGKWYYLKADGAMQTGWYFDGANWYYLNQGGDMATGWAKVNGKWYYLKADGAMQTGWYWNGADWYYLNQGGDMATGWAKVNGKWYYLKTDGAMQTGWYFDGASWYYLSQGGDMATGWAKVNGKWYYLNTDGAIQTGWYFDGADWYYLNQGGDMATGWKKVNGTRYYFEKSGRWITSNDADSLSTIGDNQQLILVTASGYGTNKATIQTFEKRSKKWYPVHTAMSGYIGRNGFAYTMTEGGMSSPRGKYSVTMAFGRYQNPGTKLPYHKIQPNDVWVDDSNSQFYNTLQQKPVNGRWKSAENMNIPAYDYGFVIDYNTERTPGKGSAIFFHVSNTWTAGCTGVSKQQVVDILKWLNPAKKPVIIQTPKNELSSY